MAAAVVAIAAPAPNPAAPTNRVVPATNALIPPRESCGVVFRVRGNRNCRCCCLRRRFFRCNGFFLFHTNRFCCNRCFFFFLFVVRHSRFRVQPGPNDEGERIRNPSTPVLPPSIGIVVEIRRRPAIAVRIRRRNDDSDDDVNRRSGSIGIQFELAMRWLPRSFISSTAENSNMIL